MTPTRPIASVLLAIGLAGSGSAADLPFHRRANLVEVAGEDLGPLRGAPIDRLALMALRDGRLRPIPFQVDERDAGGEWVLNVGLQAGRDEDGGALDSNDELVFMLSDAGPRTEERPPEAVATLEIELADPLGEPSRYAYLARYPGPAPRSPVDYAVLDPTTDSIETPAYTLTFSRAIPISWAFLTYKDAAGTPGPNLIDRFKVRASAYLIFGLVEWTVNEEDFASLPVGYVDGPVRVIRRVSSRVEFGMGLEGPHYLLDTVYQRNAIFIPSYVNVAIDVGYFLQDLAIDTYLDLRHFDGWTIRTDHHPEPVAVDGRMSPEEIEMDGQPTDWIALDRGSQAVLSRFHLDEKLATVERTLLYRDDATLEDPPEADPGQKPSLGYRFRDFSGIGAGDYLMMAEIWVFNDHERGREDAFYEALRRPVTPVVRSRTLPP